MADPEPNKGLGFLRSLPSGSTLDQLASRFTRPKGEEEDVNIFGDAPGGGGPPAPGAKKKEPEGTVAYDEDAETVVVDVEDGPTITLFMQQVPFGHEDAGKITKLDDTTGMLNVPPGWSLSTSKYTGADLVKFANGFINLDPSQGGRKLDHVPFLAIYVEPNTHPTCVYFTPALGELDIPDRPVPEDAVEASTDYPFDRLASTSHCSNKQQQEDNNTTACKFSSPYPSQVHCPYARFDTDPVPIREITLTKKRGEGEEDEALDQILLGVAKSRVDVGEVRYVLEAVIGESPEKMATYLSSKYGSLDSVMESILTDIESNYGEEYEVTDVRVLTGASPINHPSYVRFAVKAPA